MLGGQSEKSENQDFSRFLIYISVNAKKQFELIFLHIPYICPYICSTHFFFLGANARRKSVSKESSRDSKERKKNVNVKRREKKSVNATWQRKEAR